MTAAKKAASRRAGGKARKKAAKKPKKPAQKPEAQKPEIAPDLAGLTPKQRVFLLEYLANGFNATKAAIAAGYSARTADSQASRLLKNVKVAAALAGRTQKAAAKREITAERVLDEIAKLAFLDPRRLYNEFGSLRQIHEMDEDVAASIAGIEVRELYADGGAIGELKKIKFADKGANLERLGRHLKLFTDRVEHGADKDFVLTVKSILQGRTKE